MKKREWLRLNSLIIAGTILAASVTGCGASSSAPASDAAVATDDFANEEYIASDEAIDYAPSESDTNDAPSESYANQAPESDAAYVNPSFNAPANNSRKNATESAKSNDVAACEDAAEYEECYEMPEDYSYDNRDEIWGERYEEFKEAGFLNVEEAPLSTFSADVDTASYANVRRMIDDGYGMYDITRDAVRVEEFINYFNYDLVKPKLGEKFGITTQLAQCPWNEGHELMMVGMATDDIDLSRRPSSNLVFLLDVSGSMASEDKLPLLQKSFLELTDSLTEKDHVSIVTYASGVNTVLKNARGNEKERIADAINSLYAGGGTNGEGGIQTAYALAEDNFIRNGNNRIILATDGDLNIGISEPGQLENLISKKKESGIYLSVLGFGTGNLRDDNMERLADKGNGNYAYIDSLFEAKKVLVEEMGATLNTVAKDVKMQVEFNPENVSAYRLIGYENRKMADQDFYDDSKDAGEIGAGHQVVALYEIIPSNGSSDIPLKYSNNSSKKVKKETCKTESRFANEYATVKVAYKEPNKDSSKMVSKVVNTKDFVDDNEKNIHFAAMVAEFAMILSDSSYCAGVRLEDILEQYQKLDDHSDFFDEYKAEFYYLVKTMSKRG